MRKRILSIIMAVVVTFASMDMSVFALELSENAGEANQPKTEYGEAADTDVVDNNISAGETETASEIEDEIIEAGEGVLEEDTVIDKTEESEESQAVSESDGKTEDLKEDEEIVTDEGVDEDLEASEDLDMDADDESELIPPQSDEEESIIEEDVIESGEEDVIGPAAVGDTFTEDMLIYRIINDDIDNLQVEVAGHVDGTSVSGTVVIPSKVSNGTDEYTVVRIGYGAFYECSSLAGITIPDSVSSIGENSFVRCHGLESITIPDGVTSIEGDAFLACINLENITIPDSVTSIGQSAFGFCNSFTNITIPRSVTSIGWNAFSYCAELTSITILNENTNIGRYAFTSSPLESFQIAVSENISATPTMDDDAFFMCNLGRSFITFLTQDGTAVLTNRTTPTFEEAVKAYDEADGKNDGKWYGWKFAEAISVPGYSVTINVNIDDSKWENCPKKFALSSDNGSTFITDLNDVPNGTYTIYDITDAEDSTDYISTDVTVAVNDTDTEAEVNYYTVTFYNDDTVFAKQIVLENAKVSAPSSSPTKDGYDFYRWVTSYGGSMEFDFENSITARTDIYASWTTNEVEILTARFYSGIENEPEVLEVTLEEGADSALVQTPRLKDMAGWTALGWNTAEDKYSTEIVVETEVPIYENTEYYGIYKKDITLSYDINYTSDVVIDTPDSQKKTAYANVHKTTGYNYPEFTIAGELTRQGYTFGGWYTEVDGSGISYETGSEVTFEADTRLYAHWTKNGSGIYKVEHYCQNADDDGYTRMDSDTQEIEGIIGEIVTAQPKNYEGFTENREHSGRVSSGVIVKDVELTLKLYYDRNVYQVNFDLNYTYSGVGSAMTPAMQSLRYGQKLSSVTTPERKGWSFKGWYKSRGAADSAGSDMSGNAGNSAYSNIDKITYDISDNRPWNFESAIEDNIDISELSSVTLYAAWVDDIAPVLDNASYNTGYKDLAGWIIRKKNLIITVPVTEEGSGVDTAEYTLTPDNGNSVSGVIHIESAYVPRQVRHDESVQLYTGENAAENTTASIQLNAENGQVSAVITVSEDYKGKIYLKCSDKAGNNSGQKNLTVENGGIIVEDNAPEISFLTGNVQNSRVSVKVTVSDKDDKDGNAYITGGIAEITYRIDDGEIKYVTYKELESVKTSGGRNGKDFSNNEERDNNEELENKEDFENDIDFQSDIVTACDFKVEISGTGTHILNVVAVDNAGNENSQNTRVSIAGGKTKKKTTVIKSGNAVISNNYTPEEKNSKFTNFVQASKPPVTQNGEPSTGDMSMRVEVYATVAMIAGTLYIFLYFSTGKNGMTEQEKNEFVSRLVTWAKSGRKYRRFVAIVMIFGVLFYYHSVGKRMDVEWNEVLER